MGIEKVDRFWHIVLTLSAKTCLKVANFRGRFEVGSTKR